MGAFDRIKLLIGEKKVNILSRKSVALFGAGGVGGFAAEALARSGVGKITVIDADRVEESNLNRQIIATAATLGKDKTEAVRERLLSVNPEMEVETVKTFYLPENACSVDFSHFDFVIDAVDTVSAKIEIICRARAAGVPVITCMGTGGKTDITKLRVSPIEKTQTCPLARVVRRELKKRNISGVPAVWSEESPIIDEFEKNLAEKKNGRVSPPSMIFVPAAAGLIAAREAVFTMLEQEEKR